MWIVSRPSNSARETFVHCISRVVDTELKRRLEGVADYIVDQAKIYAEHAVKAELHHVVQTLSVDNAVSVKEMVAVYDQRMAGKAGPGRHIYDAIKLLPKHGICPFCDHRSVSTLDHLLPKRLFPVLAVTPDNLVGVCSDCNKTKLSFAPKTAEEVILHPYFDDVEGERWLTAKIVVGPVAAAIFQPQAVAVWPDALNSRIRRQFVMLGLGALYGAQAAREISAQAFLLGKIYDSHGSGGVREELARQAETREASRINCWQAALYRALAESDWFVTGGFRCEQPALAS